MARTIGDGDGITLEERVGRTRPSGQLRFFEGPEGITLEMVERDD